MLESLMNHLLVPFADETGMVELDSVLSDRVVIVNAAMIM